MGADNTVVIALKVDNGALSSSLTQSKSKFKNFKSQLKREFAGIGRSFKTALSLGGIGGIAGLAAAGKGVLDFQRQLINLGTRAKLTGAEMKALEAQVFKVGEATAQQPEDLLEGAQAFQALTGQGRNFIKTMEIAGQVSLATGASVKDIAETQAALEKNLGLDPTQMRLAFDILARGADAGSVEFNDFASLTRTLTAEFKLFGQANDDSIGKLAEMQAMLQVGATGFGSAAEAATGLSGAMGALVKNQSQFEKAGIKLFENGKRRGLKAIFDDIRKSKLSDAEISKLFGRKEGFKFFLAMREGEEDFQNLNVTADAAGFVMADFNRVINSTPAKVDRAKVKLKEAFNKSLADNIDAIAKAMNGIASAISWIADNPKTALAIAAMGKLASIFFRSGGFGAGGMMGNMMGGGGGVFAGNPDIGKGKGKVGKVGAGFAALPAFGTGYAIGTATDEILNSYGVGSESLAPIEERESRAEMHARKARELRETLKTRTEMVERGTVDKAGRFGAVLSGTAGGLSHNLLSRRKRVQVGDDFDAVKAAREAAYHERQARALSNPGQFATPQQVDVNIKVDAEPGLKATATDKVRRAK